MRPVLSIAARKRSQPFERRRLRRCPPGVHVAPCIVPRPPPPRAVARPDRVPPRALPRRGAPEPLRVASRSAAACAAASAPRSRRSRCARCCARSPRGSRSPRPAAGRAHAPPLVTLTPARGGARGRRAASVYADAMPLFCRHNRLTANCPICSRELRGRAARQGAAPAPARSQRVAAPRAARARAGAAPAASSRASSRARPTTATATRSSPACARPPTPSASPPRSPPPPSGSSRPARTRRSPTSPTSSRRPGSRSCSRSPARRAELQDAIARRAPALGGRRAARTLPGRRARTRRGLPRLGGARRLAGGRLPRRADVDAASGASRACSSGSRCPASAARARFDLLAALGAAGRYELEADGCTSARTTPPTLAAKRAARLRRHDAARAPRPRPRGRLRAADRRARPRPRGLGHARRARRPDRRAARASPPPCGSASGADAAQPRLAPGASRVLERSRRRPEARATPPPKPRARGGCCVLGASALAALSLLLPSVPTYDPWAWIIWGREIAHGDLSPRPARRGSRCRCSSRRRSALAGDDGAPLLWLVVARAGGMLAFAMAFRLGVAPGRPVAGRDRRRRAVSPTSSSATSAAATPRASSSRSACGRSSATSTAAAATRSCSASRPRCCGPRCGRSSRSTALLLGWIEPTRRANDVRARRRRRPRAASCGSSPSTSAPATSCAPPPAPASRTRTRPRSPRTRSWRSSTARPRC